MNTYESTEVEGTDRVDITEHREPASQGGERYVRCEGCRRELLVSLGGRHNLPHPDDCPNATEDA